MDRTTAIQLSEAQRHEVASWIATHQESFPEAMRIFFAAHEKYLSAGADLERRFEETYRELRRALGITASSERRRIRAPFAAVPRAGVRSAGNEQEKLEAKRDRSQPLGRWYGGLTDRHTQMTQRIEKRLEKMKRDQTVEGPSAEELAVIEDTPVEDIKLTPEQEAANEVRAEEFVEHLEQGDGADPELNFITGGSYIAY